MASDKPSNFMDDDGTMEILYKGKATTRVDVLLCTALTGNGIETWEKEGTVWLRDVLPEAIPVAHVSTGNGYADILRFCNKTGQNTILRRKEDSLLGPAGGRAEEDRNDPPCSAGMVSEGWS